MLTDLPVGNRAILRAYGEPFRGRLRSPLHVEWMNDVVPYLELPEPWASAWDTEVPVTRLRLRRELHPSAASAFRRVCDEIGMDELRIANMDRIALAYQHRRKLGEFPEQMSAHAWGIALDFNPFFGPVSGWRRHEQTMSNIWRQLGWDCRTKTCLHVQACKGY